MSSRQYLLDSATRHAVFLQRYAGGEAQKAVDYLAAMRIAVVGRLSEESTVIQYGRQRALLADIDSIMAGLTDDMKGAVTASMNDFAAHEAEFSAEMAGNAATVNFTTPSNAQLATAINTVPFNVGSKRLTVAQALQAFGDKKRKEIMQMIQDGAVLGDTTSDIMKAVSAHAKGLQRRQLEALVRTATNHIAATARDMMYQENADVMEGYEWVATLDSRTTIVCGGRDGMVFTRASDPKPPAHWGCRSTTIPRIKPEYSLKTDATGARPALGGQGYNQEGSNVTYQGWLRRQSAEFQDEALGKGRGKLFRSGKIALNGFVDPTGELYSLDYLKAVKGLTL